MHARGMVGAEIARRYRLVRLLGEGPRGPTFEAADADGRTVVVKLLARSALSAEAVSRHIQAVSALASLHDRNLAGTIDVAHDLERGLLVLVREPSRGLDVATVLALGAPIDPLGATRIVAQATAAVGAAHTIGIVHGNVKPSNVLLEPTGDGLVAARVCDVAVGGLPRLDPSSAPPAWLRYIAPERLGSPPHHDARGDVYALGAILFALLTGSETDAGSVDARAPWVDARIVAIVRRALASDPSRRFASATALGDALRAVPGVSDPLEASQIAPVASELHASRSSPAGDPPPSSRPSVDPLIGHRLGRRYTIVRELGRGGMGSVYEVESPDGARHAAKIIAERGTMTTQVMARFLREAQSATRVEDVHVVRTIELGTDMTLGAPFIVMELLAGWDLGRFLEQRGALAPEGVARAFVQASRGLGAAHRSGIVHRDIKPANIFLAVDGDDVHVKICDFGLAKAFGEGEGGGSRDLTAANHVVGTPLYMSPEQVTGGALDARSDLWSLCASLWEALSGRKLWEDVEARSPDVVAAICTRPIRSLRDVAPWVPPGLADAVHRGLERDRSRRWSGADELIDALSPYAGDGDALRLSDLVSVSVPSMRAAGVAGVSTALEGANSGSLGRATMSLGTSRPSIDEASADRAPSPPGSRDATTTSAPRARARRLLWIAPLVGGAVALFVAGRPTPRSAAVPSASSSAMIAVAARECTTNAECARSHGGEAWICRKDRGRCVALASEDCKALADDGDVANDDTIWLGTMLPTTGPSAEVFGTRATRGVELARRELATVSRGLPARGDRPRTPIGLVTCDDGADPARAAAHLVRDLGVPAVIGFRNGDEVIDLGARFFVPSGTLALSLNASPLITSVPHPPDGPRFIWRVGQGVTAAVPAMSLLMSDSIAPALRKSGALAGAEKLRAIAILDATGSALGIEDALFDKLRLNGTSALANKESFRVVRCSGGPADRDWCRSEVDSILAFRPHVVLYPLGGGQLLAERLFRPLEERWPKDARFRPWYLTGGWLNEGKDFFAFLDERPDRRRRFLGTTTPYNAASAKLVRRYNEAFGTNIEETVAPTEVYDAFYLLAYAAFAAGPRPSGADLARQMARFGEDGARFEIGPANVLRVFDVIAKGEPVHLEGASGTFHFDATGERYPDLDIVCPSVGADGHTFDSTASGLRYDRASDRLIGELRCK